MEGRGGAAVGRGLGRAESRDAVGRPAESGGSPDEGDCGTVRGSGNEETLSRGRSTAIGLSASRPPTALHSPPQARGSNGRSAFGGQGRLREAKIRLGTRCSAGDVAQWESTCFASRGSRVRIPPSPPSKSRCRAGRGLTVSPIL